MLRTVGDSAEAAHALGYSIERVRTLATMAGGFLAGIGGSFLSLYYPGNWNEGLSSGQGLMAVALVMPVSTRRFMEAIYARGELWTEWRWHHVRQSARRYAKPALPRSRPLHWIAK
jgi:hypothetical protein